jgi:hypothetical protein
MKTKESNSNHGGVRKGAGRPRLNEPRVTICMSMDEETANSFKNLTKELGKSQPKTLKTLLDIYSERA